MRRTKSKRLRIPASFTAAPARWWLNLLVPALPVLACFLGGATQKWSEGIVVAVLGLMLLVHPPRFSLGPALNLILLALLACAAIAFLPSSWFTQPGWRTALAEDFGIKLAHTLSPQPWISLSCFLSLIAGMSWLYHVSTLDLDLRDVRTQLRTFAFGVALLAALCVALYAAHTALPFWHNYRGFGPFPNRNQTANLFSLAAIVILACGQDDLRQGKKRWIFWLFAFGTIVAAIILNLSRAGVLILLAGTVLWLGAFALRQGVAARIALGISAVLALMTVLLVFGGQTFERFNLRTGGAAGIASDFRWTIFSDALHLIRASPWPGIGLGNFDAIFAIFRDASLNGARALHPESDWFWLWVEVGWPAVVLTIVGLGLLVWRVFPLQEGTNQRFRVAALIGAVLFVLHGLVDVSAHRVGTAYAGIFLLGLALRRPAELRPSLAASWIFRSVGIVLLAAGIAWVFATRYEKSLPGAIGVENEMRLATAANRGRNFTETIQRTTRALDWEPLRWQLYFLRALGKVGARLPASEAVVDFRRARFLEPNVYEVPFEEGNVWVSVSQPGFALTAWREALRRAGDKREELYRRMLTIARQSSPAVYRGLETMGMAQHDLAVAYLGQASGENFIAALRGFLERNPRLETLTPQEKVMFFKYWGERGDPASLARAVETRPEWLKEAWPSVAKYHASQNNFQAAVEIVRRYGGAPVLPPVGPRTPIDQLRQALHADPDNYGIGFQLYQEQMNQSQIDEALVTVRHFTDLPNCPRYFHFLESEAWAAKKDWERAWKARQKFESGQTQ